MPASPPVARSLQSCDVEPSFTPAIFNHAIDKRRNTGMVEETVLSLSYGRIVIKPPEKLTGLVPASFETYQVMKPGDIVIRTTNLQNDWTSLRVGLVKDPGIITSAYAGLQPTERYSPEFLYYLLHSYDTKKVFYGMGSGLRQNIGFDDFKWLPFICPSRPEQDAIVAYLDGMLEAIDRYLRVKEREIALMEERKRALIHRAVTRGLDANPQLQPSGRIWPDFIPHHWRIAPLYARYDVQLGKMLDAKKISGLHLQPYLRNTDVQWDSINVIDLPQMDFRPDEWLRYRLQTGDILVCEGGQPGRAAIWRGDLGPCFYQKALHRLRPRTSDDVPGFFFYVLFSAVSEEVFAMGTEKATISHLTGEQLRRFRFPFPPESEQREIVDFLDAEVEKIDTTIARARRQIERMQEYRSALIAEAVTGKIDVNAAS